MNKAIRYLSLAAKAGKLIIGEDDCLKSVKKGKARLIILAADAAANACKRGNELASMGNIGIIKTVYTKAELAQAVGRGSSVALAILIDEGLAAAFAAAAVTGSEQEEQI